MSLPIPKTFKLFIGGAFPRSESGRVLPIADRRGRVIAQVSHASRKDLRDAVEAARGAHPKWWGMTAYNRGQILYRMAEMLDARRDEFIDALAVVGPNGGGGGGGTGEARAASSSRLNGTTRGAASKRRRSTASTASSLASSKPLAPKIEVAAAVERLIGFAGWADKHAELLGRRAAVAGPYHVFSHAEPCGVTAVIAPDAPPLLGLVALVAAALCVGNTVVAIASDANPLPAVSLGEVLATSDLPGGVVNILTGARAELLPIVAEHREIRAISAAELSTEQATTLRMGAAENLKRVTIRPRGRGRGRAPGGAGVGAGDGSQDDLRAWLDHDAEIAPAAITPFVEIKTIWHPSAV